MKNKAGYFFHILLIIFDACAIVFSYLFAFYIRTHIDTRPYYFMGRPIDSVSTILLLIPIWLLIIFSLGLYKKDIFAPRKRIRETTRLFFASILGTMLIVTVSFLKEENVFPVRLVAFYSTILCFIFLVVFRFIIRSIRKMYLSKGKKNVVRALIVGNNKNTKYLADFITDSPEAGYRIAGIVAGAKFIPKSEKKHQYSSVKEALKKTRPDVIFQTDERSTEYVYKQALNRHIPYYFVPSEAALSSQLGELELIGETPAILVKVTPLAGGGQIVKRFFDITLSFIALLVFVIPMMIVWVIIKFSDPKHKVFFSQTRLSLNGKKFSIYKFRTMKTEYSGMTAEEAFKKMGKPELIKKYNENGQFLDHDPRITKLGSFLRKTSIDELPQLWNILKGDISLVGPRALPPNELKNYKHRAKILSVKSGLTGLAQVSGRRDIPFDERRKLDIYYVNNWSLSLDFQILVKTVLEVLKHEGAK